MITICFGCGHSEGDASDGRARRVESCVKCWTQATKEDTAKAQIQRELAAVRAIQSQYEAYCEQERAADRMPKDYEEWQRERLYAALKQ